MPASRASQLHRTKRLSGQKKRGALLGVVLAVVLGPVTGWASPASDALTKARQYYNERKYDLAIENAQKAVSVPAFADGARVVIGRSYLELFRQSSKSEYLEAGRNALRQVQVATLTARERADLLIGLGESLYLDNAFGPAAEIFSSAIAAATPREIRDSVLDWWASSLERTAAPPRPAADREDIYYQIVERMDDELAADPTCTPAAYWLVAAARGAGDLDRAWEAAKSGWVRALLSPANGIALRDDLDHLVTTAIIPERASAQASREADKAADKVPADRAAAERAKAYKENIDSATEEMKKQWDEFKAAWK